MPVYLEIQGGELDGQRGRLDLAIPPDVMLVDRASLPKLVLIHDQHVQFLGKRALRFKRTGKRVVGTTADGVPLAVHLYAEEATR